MSQNIIPTISTISTTSSTKLRRKPKIEKTNEEFKQHESILMNKRNQEVNNAVTKKCHAIWNQYLFHKHKPNPLQFNFVYHNIDKYLTVCDNYEPSQHKDPKQKWWNNQKASEMSQGFLPSVLQSTDQMAEFLGQHITETLQVEFTNYCVFELLETAISSVFSTMRSGSNEVYLRTSFQYSKANLRKKLVSYFSDNELRPFDLKMRKKKDLWSKLIKEKKDKLLNLFTQKRDILHGHGGSRGYISPPRSIKMQPDDRQYHIPNLPPSVQSDNMSCSTTSNPSNPAIPPINWNEVNTNCGYQPFQTVVSTPYSQTNQIRNCYVTPAPIQRSVHCQSVQPRSDIKLNGYGNHRQCTDCLSYMNKMSELLNVNQTLQRETGDLKRLNHQYVADRQEWRNKYNNLLLKFQNLSDHNNNNNNTNNNGNSGDWMTMDNNTNNNNNGNGLVMNNNQNSSYSAQPMDNNTVTWMN